MLFMLHPIYEEEPHHKHVYTHRMYTGLAWAKSIASDNIRNSAGGDCGVLSWGLVYCSSKAFTSNSAGYQTHAK